MYCHFATGRVVRYWGVVRVLLSMGPPSGSITVRWVQWVRVPAEIRHSLIHLSFWFFFHCFACFAHLSYARGECSLMCRTVTVLTVFFCFNCFACHARCSSHMCHSYVAQLSCLLACLLVERAQAVEGIVAMRICHIWYNTGTQEQSHVRMLSIACFLPFFPF